MDLWNGAGIEAVCIGLGGWFVRRPWRDFIWCFDAALFFRPIARRARCGAFFVC